MFLLRPRLAAHIGNHRSQLRIGVVGVAARDTIGEAVVFALVILLHNRIQIAAVGIQGARRYRGQLAKTPVGPDKRHRQPGKRASQQRVHDARQRHLEPLSQQIEAEQHQQRDKKRRLRVLHLTKGEKQHAADHDQHQLAFGRRHQPKHRQADGDARQRTADTQREPASRGVIVRLADKQAGKQDPVAAIEAGNLNKAVADTEHHRHAHRVAEQRRGGRHMSA